MATADNVSTGSKGSEAGEVIDVGTASTILTRTWRPTLAVSWFVFLLFEGLIEYDRVYSSQPLCPHKSLHFGEKFQNLNYGIVGGAAVIWLLIAIKMFRTKNSLERVPLFVALNISTMSTVSMALSTVLEWGGVCTDPLNVTTPAALYGCWLSAGPLLIYITITMADRASLSSFDICLIVSFLLCVLSAFFIVQAESLQWGQLWIGVSWICYAPCLYLPWLHSIESSQIDADVDVSGQRSLAILLVLVLFPAFTLDYLAAALGYIDAPTTILIHQLLSLLTVCMYAGIALDAHVDLIRDSARTKKMQLEHQRADSARRVFMKYIFHEVRSPLSSLAMGISFLQMSNKLDEAEKEPLLMMEAACKFMSETLDGVLSMQKIEEGKLVLEMTPFELTAALEKCVTMYRAALVQKEISASFNISPSIPPCLIGDMHRVVHIFSNLFSNAIKFSPRGGVITIEATCAAPEKNETGKTISVVTVSVKDQGAGISETNQALLFNNFVQISPGSQQQGQGSGLGLSLVKRLVQIHGGTTGLSSKEGDGSTFSFTIPFVVSDKPANAKKGNEAKANAKSKDKEGTTLDATSRSEITTPHDGDGKSDRAAESAAEGASPAQSSSSSSSSSPLSPSSQLEVLAADDSSTNLKMLAMLLKRKGVAPKLCEDGQEAVDSVVEDQERYKLIFMDSVMPRLSGLEATRRLRELGYRYLVCGITGNVMDEDVHEFIDAGADLVLGKPLQMDALDKLLAHVRDSGFVSRSTEGMMLSINKDEAEMAWAAKDW